MTEHHHKGANSMSVAEQAVAMPAVDFGTPEYTTITRDIAYGVKTSTTEKNKDGSPKKEYVTLDPEEAEKLGDQFEGTIVTYTYDLPTNWAAVRAFENLSYVDSEGKGRDTKDGLRDLVTLFRPGIQAKLMNRIRQTLLETDESGNLTFNDSKLTDGKFNVTAEIISPSKRVVLTEEQKTWKSLSSLPAAVRENMWRVYLSSINKDFYVPESVE